MNQSKLQDLALLLMRITVGLTLAYFGSQKAFGVFHGPGFEGTLGFMKGMGIPSWLASFAIAGELLGGLGIAFGVLTRLAAFGAACTMFTACYFATKDPGIPTILSGVNPMDLPKFFFPAGLGVSAVCLMLSGGGAYCLDKKLSKSGKRNK